jgi:hypothetical protein
VRFAWLARINPFEGFGKHVLHHVVAIRAVERMSYLVANRNVEIIVEMVLRLPILGSQASKVVVVENEIRVQESYLCIAIVWSALNPRRRTSYLVQ